MARYLALLRFTEQGLRNVQQSSQRAAAFRADVKAAGGNVAAQYWAIGPYDGCVVFETPNEEAAASLLLKLGQSGDVRSETMRLYDEEEFAAIVNHV